MGMPVGGGDERELRMRLVAGGAVASRIAVGMAFVMAPRLVSGAWVGTDAERPGAQALSRALGVRDALIGVGGALAVARNQPLRPWLQMGAIADAADALITVASFPRLQRVGRWPILLVAAASSAGFAWLASQVE